MYLLQRNTSRHGAKPLKVQVMHKTVVAHQQFALKMITWLQTIIGQSGQFYAPIFEEEVAYCLGLVYLSSFFDVQSYTVPF